MPVPRVAVRGVTVDVTDLSRGRRFWSRLLGVHLEVSPADPDSAITWIESLGGTRIDDEEGTDHALTVMCDPDGNESCVNRRPSVALLGTTDMP